MIHILLFGENGQVAYELARALAVIGKITGVGRDRIDFCALDTISTVIQETNPDVIINSSAYTAVDKAEEDPKTAMLVNGLAPGVIANEAKKINAPLIHYSTDYIFNGESSRPYRENDTPDPINQYGKTKLAGDKAIQESEVPYLILRTSWVYGNRGKNFFLTIQELAKNRSTLSVINDQVGAPTWCRHIAEATSNILFMGKSNLWNFIDKHSGIYNVSGSGETTWYGFAKAIISRMKAEEVQTSEIKKIDTKDYPTAADRPHYSVLDNSRLENVFGLKLPDWQDSLDLVMECNK